MSRGWRLPLHRTQAAPRPASEHDDELRLHMTGRRTLAFAAFVLLALAVLYVVLPQLGGLRHTWDRLRDANVWWLAFAAVVQVAAMASYIVIFQGVHVPPGSPITLRESYLITMASLAATRLFAAGGAGGVALTAWALRRSGMERREVAERMIAFLVLLYGVYMAAMVVCGLGLAFGLFAGRSPVGLTIVPAAIGLLAIVVFALIGVLPEDFEERLGRRVGGETRRARTLRRLAAGPASLSGGVRFALEKLRHPDLAMTGTVLWWGLNITVLYGAFRAFGNAPPLAILIQGYFVGLLANLLPLPGGVGGVDGGLIGAYVAFGSPAGLALVAVLVYRLLAFWLPSIPGAIAYVSLRRRVAGWRAAEEGAAGSSRPAAVPVGRV